MAAFPCMFFAVADLRDGCVRIEPNKARVKSEFRRVFADAFIDNELRQILSMKVFAGGTAQVPG